MPKSCPLFLDHCQIKCDLPALFTFGLPVWLKGMCSLSPQIRIFGRVRNPGRAPNKSEKISDLNCFYINVVLVSSKNFDSAVLYFQILFHTIEFFYHSLVKFEITLKVFKIASLMGQSATVSINFQFFNVIYRAHL